MRKALLITALAAALVVPGTAQAGIFEGSGQDPTGDAPAPSRDIASIAARYDDSAGAVQVTVGLAAAPDSSDPLVAAFVARGCGGQPFALLLDHLLADPGDPGVWRTDTDATVRPLTRGGAGATMTLAATDFGALGFERYDCLTVRIILGSQTLDEAQATLVDVTPPDPDPAPAPSAPRAPEPPPLGPSPLTRAEKLEAALAACATGPAPRRKKCSRSARKRYGPSRPQRLRAALDRCRSRSCVRRAKARYPGVKPAPKPTGLERRLFAHSEGDINGVCGGVCWEALSFVDRRYVYVGLPTGAGVPNCRTVTYDPKREEGCATYRVSGNTVTVLNRRYTVESGGKALTRPPEAGEKERTKLDRQVFPGAGARWDVPLIEAIGVYGSPFVGTQVIEKTYLTLTREGQFVKSSVVFGSSAPGVDPSISFSKAPPDSRGTYEILPAGTIRFRYEDGKTEVGPVFFWDPSKGRDPNTAGLHAIDDTFFGPPD